MVDGTKVTVSSDGSLIISLDITAQNNSVSTEFVQSISSVIAGHDSDYTAHSVIIEPLEADIASINKLKADVASTYTKDEANVLLDTKYAKGDTIVTVLGNNFNGANQLIQLNSQGQIPPLDGSLLTAFPSNIADIYLSNIAQAQALTNLGFAGYLLASNGYYKFPSGFTIQWGYISATTSSANQTITFPIAFSNDCMLALPIPQYPSTGAIGGYHSYVLSKSATSFTTNYTMTKYWFAIGY